MTWIEIDIMYKNKYIIQNIYDEKTHKAQKKNVIHVET